MCCRKEKEGRLSEPYDYMKSCLGQKQAVMLLFLHFFFDAAGPPCVLPFLVDADYIQSILLEVEVQYKPNMGRSE